jgi:hypothetical protein
MRQFTLNLDFSRVARTVGWLVIIGLLGLITVFTLETSHGVWNTYWCCTVMLEESTVPQPQRRPIVNYPDWGQTYVTEGMEELELMVKLRKEVKDLRTEVDNLTLRVEELEK